MGLFGNKTQMPSADEALPGRATAIPVTEKHHVLGNPLAPPFPEGDPPPLPPPIARLSKASVGKQRNRRQACAYWSNEGRDFTAAIGDFCAFRGAQGGQELSQQPSSSWA